MQHTRLVPAILVAAVSIAGTACTATTVGSATEQPASLDTTVPTTQPPAPALERTEPSGVTAAPTPPIAPDARLEPEPVPPTPAPAPDPEPSPLVVTATTEPEPDPAPDPEPGSIAVTTTAPDPAPVITIQPVLTIAPCGPVGALPETAAGISSTQLDVTGDGSADDVATAYLEGGTWTLRLVTAGGTASELTIPGVGPGFVEVLGAVALGDGPDDKFLAVVGSSASGLRVGAFGADADGCLVRFDGGGDPIEFHVGATIGSVSGLRCGEWNGGHYLESLGAADQGGGAYNVYGTTWHQDDVDSLWAENGTHLFAQTFDQVEGLATIDCPGIVL